MTEQESSPLRRADVVELLQMAELREIKYYELSARLRTESWDKPEDAPVAEPDTSREAEEAGDEQDSQLVVNMRSSSTSIEVRVRMAVRNQVAEFVADVSAWYHFSEQVYLDDDLRTEFGERIGVMAVWPFLREALHAQGAKLRTEIPLLGIIRQGQVSLRDVEPQEGTPRSPASD